MSDNTENKATQAAQPTAQPAPKQAQPTAQQPAQPQPQAAQQNPQATQQNPQATQKQSAPNGEKPNAQKQSDPKPQSSPPTRPQGERPDKLRKKKKRKTDWGGRIITGTVAIIVGFAIGVGSVYGTVAGIAYMIGSQPVDESVRVIDTLTGLDLYSTIFGEVDENGNLVKGGILAKKYESLKLKDLINDVSAAIGGLVNEGTTLGDVTEISPYVGDTVDKLLKSIEKYGIPFEKEELLNAPFQSSGGDEILTDYLLRSFMHAPAGDLISALLDDGTTLSPIITAFCYGAEGIDYVLAEDGSIVMLEGKHKVTLQDVFGGDTFAMLNNVPIDLLLTVDTSDALMCAFAYGESYRYTLLSEGGESKVQMNQVTYTWQNSASGYQFFDHGDKITYAKATVENHTATLQIDTGKTDENASPVYETLYVDLNDTDGNVWLDAAKTQPKRYGKVTIGGLQADAMAVIDGIALSDVLTIDPDEAGPLQSIVFAADGSPRTIGDLRANSNNIVNDIKLTDVFGTDNTQLDSILYKTDEHGEYILVNGEKQPRTIGDLQNDSDLLNNVKVADILGVTYGDGSPLESILFKENPTTHQMQALTIKQLGEDDDLINDIQLAKVLSVDKNTNKALLSIIFDGAYNIELDGSVSGTSRTLGQLVSDPDVISNIKLCDVVEVDENTNKALLSILYEGGDTSKPRTVNDLSQNSNEIINGIKLCDVIQVDESANKAILSILYEGGDTSKPRTAQDLSQNSDDIINGIKLCDVIQPDASNAMLHSLLYVNGDTSMPRTLGDFSANSEQIINDIKLADVLQITDSSHKALIFLAYGCDSTSGTPRTLGDIRNSGDALINDIPLSYVVPTDMNDKITSYLLYGTQGVHYTVTTEGTAQMLRRVVAVKGDTVYNEYGEALAADRYTLSGNTFTEKGTAYTLTESGLADTTLADGSTATTYYLLDSQGNAVYFKERTIASFSGTDSPVSTLTAHLTARDVLGSSVDDNVMLKHLADTPVNQLSTAVKKLTFGQVFEDKIYKTDSEGHRSLDSIWRYMMTDETGRDMSNEYTVVDDMNKLVDNMKINVKKATLNELQTDGFMSFPQSTLNASVTTKVTINGIPLKIDFHDNNGHPLPDNYFAKADGVTPKTLGELTVEDIILYLGGLVTFLGNLS